MLYKEIYKGTFLDKFGKYKEEISNLALDKSFKIDVEAIADICEVSLNYDCFESPGFSFNNEPISEDEGREILVNKFEPTTSQRLTIAHELGHIILRHKWISYRTPNIDKYKDTIERMYDVAASKFTAELLMPETLVRKALISTMDELGYPTDQRFDKSDIKQLVDISADKMGVSATALVTGLKI